MCAEFEKYKSFNGGWDSVCFLRKCLEIWFMGDKENRQRLKLWKYKIDEGILVGLRCLIRVISGL